MKHTTRFIAVALAIIVSLGVLGVSVQTQDRGRGGPVRIAAVSFRDIREWDVRITRMERQGELRLRKVQTDTLVSPRKFIRLDQFYRGVPVWGGEVVAETDEGRTLSVLTNLYEGIDVGTAPRLSVDDAKLIIERVGGATLGANRLPRLVVYRAADGAFRLAYTERVATLQDVRRFFIDAATGERIADFSEVLRQSAVGLGTGVLGDAKKISTTLSGGIYVADDGLRPPALHTYDLHGNPWKLLNWLNGIDNLSASDLASDVDNTWTDVAAVDAHVHSGWTYDFYYKRFGRRGLDDSDSRVLNVVHPVRRGDLSYYLLGGFMPAVEIFYVNAFYLSGGTGIFVFGEGLPSGWTYGGRTYTYLAGGLDVVAHEFTHGVTDFSSRLEGDGEPRSLNEAFSDMMAVSIDFYYRPGRANYTVGEDVVSGGIRSLANPAAFGGADHYSKRGPAVGSEYENSNIASHAFYLAIEGGTNKTSGMSVQGVGATNREQVEKCFYRGFTTLTSQGTFSLARARTIDSARVLYGAGSPAERAITQAWDAVGVF